MRYADFGSVSSGTLRTADLLEAFTNELEYQLKRQPRSYSRKEARDLLREAYKLMPERRQRKTKASDYDPAELVNLLKDVLGDFAPPYCYFGTHAGDGADFGYWVSDDVFETHGNFDGLRVSDTSEVPKDYRGEVLHTNDHGNATLYVAGARGKLKEIWACV